MQNININTKNLIRKKPTSRMLSRREREKLCLKKLGTSSFMWVCSCERTSCVSGCSSHLVYLDGRVPVLPRTKQEENRWNWKRLRHVMKWGASNWPPISCLFLKQFVLRIMLLLSLWMWRAIWYALGKMKPKRQAQISGKQAKNSSIIFGFRSTVR